MKSRRMAAKTLDSLEISDILCFMAGWHPPTNDFERSRSRWATWEEFDSDYAAVRNELLTSDEWAQAGETPFAERRYQAQHQGGVKP